MRERCSSLFQTALTVQALLRHPHMQKEQLVTFQNARLRRLVHHAYQQVPYYRELFDRYRLHPRDIRTVSDLSAVPITTRNDLQQVPVESILSRSANHKDLIIRSSSGSTGRPLTIRRTWLEERVHSAFRLRALHALGLGAADKVCYVMQVRTTPWRVPILHDVIGALKLERQRVINALQQPEEIIRSLHQFGPRVIVGYPGVLSRVAQSVNRETWQSLRLRYVNTGGEVLTPLMRQQIETGFGVPVYDTYGSIEFFFLAWECPATGEYHSCDDSVIMEVVRQGLPVTEGETGEVVGTDLHSYAMPLIRYQLGDLVRKGSETCRCGKPFSTIRSIQGRMIDYFVLPDQRVIHPYEFGLPTIPWIRAFQMTQHTLHSIVLKVVPFHQPSAQEMAALVQSVVNTIGSEVQFTVELVTDIPIDANGKYRVYRSHVQSAYDHMG